LLFLTIFRKKFCEIRRTHKLQNIVKSIDKHAFLL